jgi:D-amino peptidase
MMRVYIHTDIEGVAGWVFYTNATSASQANLEHLRRMNQLLTAEVVAACRGAMDAGADEVWVNDAHGPAYSILFEQLPSRCQIIHGRPGYFDQWLACMSDQVDALVCVGQHAMAGTPQSVCPHSLWHVNEHLKLSETTMAAALAGCWGVPMVCVTGDDKICAECLDKVPNLQTAVVKWGIGAQNARALCPTDACQLIYQAVKRGVERRAQIKPYVLTGPFRLNVSDRDPTRRELRQDVCGHDLRQVMLQAANALYAHFGEDPLDDRSYRYPA